MGTVWQNLLLFITFFTLSVLAVDYLRRPEPYRERRVWLEEETLLLAIRWQLGTLAVHRQVRVRVGTYEGRHRARVA